MDRGPSQEIEMDDATSDLWQIGIDDFIDKGRFSPSRKEESTAYRGRR